MKLVNNDGSPKIVPRCTLPLTAMKAVDMVVTELALFSFENDGRALIELLPGITLAEGKAKTAARFVEKLRWTATV